MPCDVAAGSLADGADGGNDFGYGSTVMALAGDYLETTRDVYRQAALEPQQGLCCTTNPVWQLPELSIPGKMLAMNYGCGSTVHPATWPAAHRSSMSASAAAWRCCNSPISAGAPVP